MNWTREQYEEYIRNRDKGAGTASKLECDPGHGALAEEPIQKAVDQDKADEIGLCCERGKHIRTKLALKNTSIAQIEASSRIGVLEKRAEIVRKYHLEHGHPRGMLGKHHTQEVCDIISKAHKGKPLPREQTVKAMKTKMKRYGSFCPNVKCGSWKAAWREIGGMRKFYRSQWEANYARYLEFQKQRGLIKEWKHECETFWFDGLKRGCVSYLPDFKVTLNDGSVEYHEVKGWMDSASKTKIKRMAKYHPEIKLRIFDGKWYKENSRKLSGIIKDWECTRPDTYRSPSGKGGNRGNNHNH